MAIRNIRYDGDDILRKVCRPVEKMDDRTLTLIDDMFDTMYEANGVGLAAPQVGILKRIVVIDVGDDNPLCLINPVITESDGEQTGEEGCLSLPGKFGTVTRPMHVICKAFDENMEELQSRERDFWRELSATSLIILTESSTRILSRMAFTR